MTFEPISRRRQRDHPGRCSGRLARGVGRARRSSLAACALWAVASASWLPNWNAPFVESECATWQEYQTLVSNGALFEQLVETLTIGETYFYRHRPYFEMLEREVLPEIIAKRRDSKRLRVWCAGCATGEEAYSLAIAVRGLLPDIDAWQVTVLATDLNRGYLARAEAVSMASGRFAIRIRHSRRPILSPKENDSECGRSCARWSILASSTWQRMATLRRPVEPLVLI